MKYLGEKLRRLRKKRGYTLRELGEKLNMSFSILAMYERGERTPPVDKLVLLAGFFDVSTDYLLGKTAYRNCQGWLAENLEYSEDKVRGRDTIKKVPVFYSIFNHEKEIAERDNPEYRIVCRNNLEDGNYFYLKVGDNSMAGSRIKTGDLVLVQETLEMESGSIALVCIKNGEKTGDTELLRRIYYNNKQVILEPDNNEFEPIILNHSKVRIIGKVIRVEFDL